MTVYFHTGFDLFGAQANADGDGPAAFAGLTTHPGKPTLTNSNPAGREHGIGVSGLERHKVGRGASRRNSLVMYSGAKTQNAGNVSAMFPLPAGVLPAVVGATAVFGFRMKRGRINPAGTVPPNAYHTVIMANGAPIFGFNPTTGSTQFFLGSTSYSSYFDFREGQEYYIELLARRTTTANAYFEIWVDGTRIYTSTATSYSTFLNFTFGNAGGNYAWNQYIAVSDVYVADTRLGPQQVISRQPSVAVVKNWTPSEGNDGLALISGANTTDDTKFIVSPADTSEDRYHIDFNLAVGFKAYAASLFVRGKRDPGSTRKVRAGVFNRATGTEVEAAKSVVTEFSQNAWRTDLLWSSDTPATLTPENLNSMDVNLTSPLT